MKQAIYLEGQKALENFEKGMKSLFKVPKEKVAKAAKKNASRSSQTKKPKPADEN
ncbi:MAG: hypothetical protein ABSA80_09860 [Terriglobales bacterium]|jgi:hypothetical protein